MPLQIADRSAFQKKWREHWHKHLHCEIRRSWFDTVAQAEKVMAKTMGAIYAATFCHLVRQKQTTGCA